MKKIFLGCCLLYSSAIFSQNVGIGTTVPKARFHVADSSTVFSASGWSLPSNPGNPPLEGGGRRLMWYVDKGAFRTGAVVSTAWDKDSIGDYSFACGLDSKAMGLYSTAMGVNNNALNWYNFVAGAENTTWGVASAAIGYSNRVNTAYSFALGSNLVAKNNDYSFVIGNNNDTSTYFNGSYVPMYDQRIFQIGNGFGAIRSNAMTVLNSGNVGIGTLFPRARLHVDSSVVFTGRVIPAPSALPAVSGAGTRMLWYSEKSAFRTGTVTGTQWDRDNVGYYSIAGGYDAMATASHAIAFGNRSTATGTYSIALGDNNIASGSGALALGISSFAEGNSSVSMGVEAVTRGYSSFSIGNNTIAKNDYQLSIGRFNDTTGVNKIFEIGIGAHHSSRANALTVTDNGNTGIGIVQPLAGLQVANKSVVFTNVALPATAGDPPVSGAGIRMMWYADKAAFRAGRANNNEWSNSRIGNHSFAAGYGPEASGESSSAMGFGSVASGFAATAFGNSRAAGDVSTSFGQSNANAPYAFSTGEGTFASSRAAASFGYLTKAKSMYSLVAGQFNDTTTANSLFEIGNGTADNNRRNALTVLTNGNVGIGNKAPLRPLSFTATLGEKILLYPGNAGEVGIGVYGNELRLHADNPGAKVSFGTQTNAGVFTEAGKFEIAGGYALTVFGNIWANGITYNSDTRFKKNIVPLNNAIQKIQKINGVQYEMMADEYPGKNFIKGTQVGLLAQEVEVVMPQVVSTNEEGYKSVDYAKLIPLLIEGMKEQQKQIEQLRQEVKELKQGK